MAGTTSLSFPNMFDVAHNQVSVSEDAISVSNRTRLLILTEPTELYNNLDFGVGLKRYIWTYNSANQKAIIQNRIKEQIQKYEPCVDPNTIMFSDGLLVTGSDEYPTKVQDHNSVKLTVSLVTTYGESLTFDLDSLFNYAYTVDSNGSKSYMKDI